MASLDDGAGQPTGNGQESLTVKMREAELRKKMADAAKVERENALADGKLIPIGDVMDRIETAAMVFRNGGEGMVRNVESVCCDQCKPVVGERVQEGFKVLSKQFVKALKGD